MADLHCHQHPLGVCSSTLPIQISAIYSSKMLSVHDARVLSGHVSGRHYVASHADFPCGYKLKSREPMNKIYCVDRTIVIVV